MKDSYDEHMKKLVERTKGYRTIAEFFKDNPYLYRWAKKHKIDLYKYIRRPVSSEKALYKKKTHGIDCYKSGGNGKRKKFYKHYNFISDVIRDLDMNYYFMKKLLNGEISEFNGFIFERSVLKDKDGGEEVDERMKPAKG